MTGKNNTEIDQQKIPGPAGKQNRPQRDQNINEYGTASINKLLLRFSIPAIIGMICNAMQNIVNRIFVGNAVGSLALDAVTVCFPVMTLFMAVSIMVGVGGTTLTAIRLGQHRDEEAEELLGQATALLFLLPLIVLLATYWFIEPILAFLGADSAVMPYAKDYLSVLMFAMIFSCPSMGLNNFIRTEGRPIVAMNTQILASAFNVFFNYLFVIVMDWGVKGAALGILLGNLISLFWIFGFFASSRSYLKVRPRNLILKPSIVTKIAILGTAPFLMQGANFVQQLIMNRTLVAYGGNNALAAISIISALATLFIMPMIGLNQGAQPIIGYNYGAYLYPRVKKTIGLAMLYATAFALASFSAVMTCSSELVSVFVQNEPEVIALADHAIKIFFCCIPVIGIQMIGAGYFQATGKPLQSALLSLSRQVLAYIPLLLILPHYMGLNGAWIASPIADVVSSAVTTTCLVISLRRLDKQAANPAKARQGRTIS